MVYLSIGVAIISPFKESILHPTNQKNKPFLSSILKHEDTGIRFVWDDGMECPASWSILRSKCPCAACLEEQHQPIDLLRVLKPQELLPIQAKRVTPVGNYAYKFEWSDGHSAGIYSLAFLRKICEEILADTI